MASPQLVDPRGRPISITRLRQQDDPLVLGLKRGKFASVVAQGLTPERLVSIFAETRRGKLENFLALAKDLEKHDAHYRSLLALRKLAVLRRKPVVQPASQETADILIAEAFQEQVVDTPEWFEMTLHAMDSLGKGFSIVEMVWDFSEGQAHPFFVKRNPIDFTLDDATLTRIVRFSEPGTEEELERGKYACFSSGLLQGNPVDGALAYTASILYLYSNMMLKDFGDFIERFGTPTLLAKYASETIKDELFEGLEGLARAGYGVVPQNTSIDVLDGARIGGSENLHERGMEFLNRLKSKLVVGQTMTSDAGSSRSQAEVHERVEESINDYDVLSVCTTQTQQIFEVWRELNFGTSGKTGTVDRPGDDEVDLGKLANLAGELADRGARVPYRRILDAAGFPDADEETDEILEPKSTGRGDIPGMPSRFELARTSVETPPQEQETEDGDDDEDLGADG